MGPVDSSKICLSGEAWRLAARLLLAIELGFGPFNGIHESRSR
jgi:hypothetical protein